MGTVTDYYAGMMDSRCCSADTCTLDSSCPFAGGCHAAEARDDDEPLISSPSAFPWTRMTRRQRRRYEHAAVAEAATRNGGDEREGSFLIPPGLRSDILALALESALIMDCGETPGAHKPIPWRTRLKRKIRDARTRLAEIAYRVVAGEWPPGEDDD